MSQSLDWQCFSVEDFFTHHNWSGKKPPQVLQKPIASAQVKMEENRESLDSLDLAPPSPEKLSQRAKFEPLTTDLKVKQGKTPLEGTKVKKPKSWQCLTVENFFSDHNWLGLPKELNFQAVIDLNSLGLEEIEMGERFDDSLRNLPEIYPQNLVQESQTITENLTQKSSSQATSLKTSGDIKSSIFSLTLSVKDFCSGIDWEGPPAIAVLPQIKNQKSTSSKEEEFTLDDLSELF